jgi:hypothetical protein
MIDPKKTYRTRDGREVRIYAVDCGSDYPVHGALREDTYWEVLCWTASGHVIRDGILRDADLIEVKPRIKREVWVNVHRDGCLSAWRHKPEPNEFGPDDDRIACVKLTIDCEEGEGL